MVSLGHEYWLFAAIGFFGQIVDGTLGMAFGIILSSSLLAFGDAVGGGGWGSLVASSLIAIGVEPRRSVGTANIAEFFVTASASAAFLVTLDLSQLWRVVLALVIGGAAAAPFSGWLIRALPPRVAMTLVAGIVLGLSIYNVVRLEI